MPFALRCFAGPGALDESFNPGTGTDQSVFAIAVQPDLKVIIAGDFATYDQVPRHGIARLKAGGSLDQEFDPLAGANDLINAVALQTNGQVVIGGYFTKFDNTSRLHLARLGVDGRLDSGYSAEADEPVLALALDASGRILVGGTFSKVNSVDRRQIARLKSDGSLDQGFDPGAGVAGEDFSAVNCLAVQKDGKILIGGHFTSVDGKPRQHLARLDEGGKVDPDFQPPVNITGAGLLSGVYALALQPDGKVLVVGDFTGINVVGRTNIARLHADGRLDLDFNPGAGADLGVSSVAVQANGKVLLGGFFSHVAGEEHNYVARVDSGGGPDPDFVTGAGFDNSVYALALQPDGKVLVGGLFSNFGDRPRSGIARLIGDEVQALVELFDPAWDTAGFHVSYRSIAGRAHRLEYLDALGADGGAWQRLAPVTGDGTVQRVTDKTAKGATRFYRLSIE